MYLFLVLDMPKRPKWNYGMSKQQLEQKEEIYFKNYLKNIYSGFGEKSLSYFEHNLEVSAIFLMYIVHYTGT